MGVHTETREQSQKENHYGATGEQAVARQNRRRNRGDAQRRPRHRTRAWDCGGNRILHGAQRLEIGLQQIVQGGHSHIIATYFAARRMAEAGHGLIISISDQEWDTFYAMEKALINRIAISVADELRPNGVAVLSLHPGAFFRCFKIMTEEALQTAVEQDPAVAKCHTPRLIGRAVVALASDPAVLQKTGKSVKIQDLVYEYGLTDIDGRQTGEMW